MTEREHPDNTRSPYLEKAITEAMSDIDRGFHIFLMKWNNRPAPREAPLDVVTTTDPAIILRGFERLRDDAQIAAVTGPKSGIFVIRCDTVINDGNNGVDELAKLTAEHGALPETLSYIDDKGRGCDFFKWPSGKLEHWKELAPGVDVVGDGDMVLLPPNGKWINGSTKIADPSEWLLRLVFPFPVIKIRASAFSEMTTLGEKALIEAHEPIYQRGEFLVRPIIDDADASDERRTKVARLKKITPTYLYDLLSKDVIWLKYVETKKKTGWFASATPPKIAETILEREGHWKFPKITGIISTQTMRPDGSLLTEPGYDPKTGLLLAHPPLLPEMKECPTRADAEEKLALLEDLLAEFRFADEANQDSETKGVDRAVALSALITPVVRGAFNVAPMHVARAAVAGSGKSYLFDISAAIAIGQYAMPVMATGGDETELEKRLGAALLSGQPLISLDNVVGELESVKLCQMIERPIVETRILGKSEQVSIETRSTTIFGTGNNIVIVGDLVRRSITTALDPMMEKPETRVYSGNPVQTVLADRGKYIAAALTICRAYIIANRPDQVEHLASFGGWSDTVRSALMWLGKADPVASQQSSRDTDPELGSLRNMLTAWSATIGFGGNSEFALAKVIAKINKTKKTEPYGSEWPVLFDAVQAVAGKPHMPADTQSLGKWLRKYKGRVARIDGNDLRFMSKTRPGGGAAMWRIEALNGQTGNGESGWWQGEDTAGQAASTAPPVTPAKPAKDDGDGGDDIPF